MSWMGLLSVTYPNMVANYVPPDGSTWGLHDTERG